MPDTDEATPTDRARVVRRLYLLGMISLRALLLPVVAAVPLVVAAAGPSGRAVLKDPAGKEVGTAMVTDAQGGVQIQIQVANLPPGRHGIHLHAAGRCDTPDFKSAGGHFNPLGKKHGLHNPEGAHAGDMPNLEVGKDGKAKATLMAKGATLAEGPGSLFGPEGTSIVIHADPDDEKTDPAGNSGARIACGIIERT